MAMPPAVATWSGLFAASLFVALGCTPPPKPAPSPPRPRATATQAPPKVTPTATASARPEPEPPETPWRAIGVEAKGWCSAAEVATARTEIQAISKQIEVLPANAQDASTLGKRILALDKTPCFQDRLAATGDLTALETVRARSLKLWWEDGMGEQLLYRLLDTVNAAYFAPGILPLIATETLPNNDPMRVVTCPSADKSCDVEADVYAMELDRELERLEPHLDDRSGVSDSTGEEKCAKDAKMKPKAERYGEFLSCVGAILPRRAHWPLGRFRTPRGWLILTGRRGHYGFCDEIRAYHFETGAAYVAQLCSSLFQLQGAPKGPEIHLMTGKVFPGALRKLGLHLFFEGKITDQIRTQLVDYRLPTFVDPPEPSDGVAFGSMLGGTWGHSGQTAISFEVLDGGSSPKKGAFTWPNAADVWDQIADDLVVTMEASFVEGCPPAALTKDVLADRSIRGVSRIDASKQALDATSNDLMSGLRKLAKQKVCAPKK